MNTSPIALTEDRIKQVIKDHTGVTFNQHLEIVEPRGLYGTAIHGLTFPISHMGEESILECLYEFVKARLEHIQSQGYGQNEGSRVVYGFWVDKDDILYLDVGLVCESRSEALLLGFATGQKCIGFTDDAGTFLEIECWGSDPRRESFIVQHGTAGEALIHNYIQKC